MPKGEEKIKAEPLKREILETLTRSRSPLIEPHPLISPGGYSGGLTSDNVMWSNNDSTAVYTNAATISQLTSNK